MSTPFLDAHRICILSLCMAGSCGRSFADQPEQQAKAAEPAKASQATDHDHGTVDKNVQAAQAAYKRELDRLRDLSAGSVDPCLNAIYVAARDGKVRSLLIAKMTNPDYVFRGVRCLDSPHIPEHALVLFDFDCRPGVFCLIDPNFLVVVDVIESRVVKVVDPYLGGPVKRLSKAARGATVASVEVFATGSNYKFEIDGQDNPTITAKQGDTVKVTLTSAGGTHDWKLVYVENGSEVEWAKTPQTGGPAVSVEFIADRVGEFDYFCSVGTHRSLGMRGKFVVEP